MLEVLHERGLSLSRKKSRMGNIQDGFHFLGIHYLPTQTENNTMVTDGFLPKRIKAYLYRWLTWWVNTSDTWQYDTLLTLFVESCWHPLPLDIIYYLRGRAAISDTKCVVSDNALAA